MLTEDEKIELVSNILALVEEERNGRYTLSHLMYKAANNKSQIEEALAVIPEEYKPKDLENCHEASALITIIAQRILDDMNAPPETQENNLRYILNMLGIDFYCDLRHAEPNNLDLRDTAFRPEL